MIRAEHGKVFATFRHVGPLKVDVVSNLWSYMCSGQIVFLYVEFNLLVML